MHAYELRIMMTELTAVSRTVIVPGKISLAELHTVIQYTMGWLDYHLYEFSTEDNSTGYTNNIEGIAEYAYYKDNPLEVENDWAGMHSLKSFCGLTKICCPLTNLWRLILHSIRRRPLPLISSTFLETSCPCWKEAPLSSPLREIYLRPG